MPKKANSPATDPMFEHLKQLLGARILGIVISGDADDEYSCYGLRLNSGKVAWIQCDPEGNGPGFLAIEPDPGIAKGRKAR